MKKLVALLSVAFILISAVILYLVRQGISIRSAPLIRPSVVGPHQSNIAKGLALRLAPEFQNSHYVIWGVLPETAESKELLAAVQKEFLTLYQKPIQTVENAHTASIEELKACEPACWLLLPKESAHELSPNEFIETKIKPLKRSYFTLTLVRFSEISEVPTHCLEQKRLDYQCLTLLSIHEAKRKMKNPNDRYFFLKKYLDRDFFLFIQDQPNP